MKLNGNVEKLAVSAAGMGCGTFDHAVAELARMLKKASIDAAEPVADRSADGKFSIALGNADGTTAETAELAGEVRHDGFVIESRSDSLVLAAKSAKGILNAVYALMEKIGYVYLHPGDDGEWAPEEPREIPMGTEIFNPRFPRRGVFREEVVASPSHSSEEWFEFFAKLRFNAVVLDRVDLLPLARKLGMRMEVGGHGFSKLLPRELFDERPELFRMFQPEDFNGKRLPDSNLCVTNPETRRIVGKNFEKKLEESKDAYALHLWPDDLPAGGWCMCPSCRAFAPEDQAMMAMRLVADEARRLGSDVRIPYLAYHDTMTPGPEISPSDNMFLLFAPRERCYAHALDDPNCPRNRFYMRALEEWMDKFAGIDDNHTFEYYFDQILFRGMHPYIPAVIADDMRVYERAGIECHLSLQVAADSVALEYNMLFFAAAHWNGNLTPKAFSAELAGKIASEAAADEFAGWLLDDRATLFARAMRMCEHNPKIYLDYRWLPETRSAFGREMAAEYREASMGLEKLAGLMRNGASARFEKLLERERKRLAFESAEFAVMSHQQAAVNELAEYRNSGNEAALAESAREFEKAVSALKIARGKALDCGFRENEWYLRNINSWLTREFKSKSNIQGGASKA